MNHSEALTIVEEYVQHEKPDPPTCSVLRRLWRFYAQKFDQDLDKWGITGLLHDFDWEIHPTLDGHPQKRRSHTTRKGGSQKIFVRAILSHAGPYRCSAGDSDGKSPVCLRRDNRVNYSRGISASIEIFVRFEKSLL